MKLGLALDQWERSQVLPVALQKIETPAAASRMGLGHERVDAELDVSVTRHDHSVNNGRPDRQGQKVLT